MQTATCARFTATATALLILPSHTHARGGAAVVRASAPLDGASFVCTLHRWIFFGALKLFTPMSAIPCGSHRACDAFVGLEKLFMQTSSELPDKRAFEKGGSTVCLRKLARNGVGAVSADLNASRE